MGAWALLQSESLTAIGGQGMEHSLAADRGALWRGWKSRVRWPRSNRKGSTGSEGWENVIKHSINDYVTINVVYVVYNEYNVNI